jgi:hypothetical protein
VAYRVIGDRARLGMAVLVSAVLVSAGCGITHSPLEKAVGDASSAAATAVVAVRGLHQERLTPDVASTAVEDAIRHISTATADLTSHKATSGAERRLQEQAVNLFARTTRNLHQARDGLTKPSARPRLERLLEQDRDELDRMSRQAGEIR